MSKTLHGSSFDSAGHAYVYQVLAFLKGEVRDVDLHLGLLRDAALRFWNKIIVIEPGDVREAILSEMKENECFSQMANYFILRVFRDGHFDVGFLYHSIYDTFTLKALHPNSQIVRTSSPLFEFPTSALYEHNMFLRESLLRYDVHVPVCVDRQGYVINIDGHSPAIIKKRRLFYSTIMEDVQMNYLLDVMKRYGIHCEQSIITESMFMDADEAMYVNEDGVTALRRCEEHVFGDLIVNAAFKGKV